VPGLCNQCKIYIYKSRFYQLSDQFSDYFRIFTDGSKVGDKVAAAQCYDKRAVFGHRSVEAVGFIYGLSVVQLSAAHQVYCRTVVETPVGHHDAR